MKYEHMNAKEIVSHIEKFGTEDEKVIVSKLDSTICEPCERKSCKIEELEDLIDSAVGLLTEGQ